MTYGIRRLLPVLAAISLLPAANEARAYVKPADVGAQAVCTSSSLSGAVIINAAWLQQHGSAPYILNQANTTYQLATDVTVPGTAFVVLAPNVTLDLGCHTITYGNTPPPVVTNGGFETGSGRNVFGWNLADAPAAAIAPNAHWLFGNQVLRLTNFSTPQTIVSDTIPISLINHTYEATITPGDFNLYYGTGVTISVIDSVTGKVLGTGSSANTQRGFSAVAAFTPTTTNPIQLKVVVTPVPGHPTSLDLDEATVNVTYDYGVVASKLWSGQFPGFGNFPTAVQSAYNGNYQRVANFTVRNGSISEGSSRGVGSSPLFFDTLNAFTVNNVTTFANGVDTMSLEGHYASGNMTVTNSTFYSSIPNITNRMALPATIALSNTKGSIQIASNKLLGSPQIGIMTDTTNGFPLAITNNFIQQKAVVTNAYAILTDSVNSPASTPFQITGNNVTTAQGDGIMLDGWGAVPTTNGIVQNNFVEVWNTGHREYGPTLPARAFQERNYDGPPSSAITNVDISLNTFVAHCGPNYTTAANAVWPSLVNPNHVMDNANINFDNNTIEAIDDTSAASYHAMGLVVDGMDPGINAVFANNIIASNDTAIGLGSLNDSRIADVLFTGNTLMLLKDQPIRPSFTGILAGYWEDTISNVSIVNSQLANGATESIKWQNLGTKSLSIGWLLDVTVTHAGAPARNASVQVLDTNGAIVFSGTTNSSGKISSIALSTLYQQLTPNPAKITTTGPATVTVTYGGKTASQPIAFPVATTTLTLTIGI